jgi:hypothetical protein
VSGSKLKTEVSRKMVRFLALMVVKILAEIVTDSRNMVY